MAEWLYVQRPSIVVALIVATSSAIACSRQSPAPAAASAAAPAPATAAPPAPAPPPHPRVERVGATFQRVNLHVVDDVVLEIATMHGALVTTRPGEPPFFDDATSFSFDVEQADVAMSGESLTVLLNSYVFAYEGAPLKKLSATIADGHLKLSGTMHKLVDVPFSIVADVSATSDGRIRLHPTSVKAIGIPTAGLMKMFGIELDELIKVKGAAGVEIAADDFLLWPDRVLPAPKIAGHLTSASVQGDRLVQHFGAAGKVANAGSGNFLFFGGGTLRFGKLTMHDTDLQLIDTHPSDAFEFSLPKYNQTLTQGYSKVTASGGLRVYMPDYRRP